MPAISRRSDERIANVPSPIVVHVPLAAASAVLHEATPAVAPHAPVAHAATSIDWLIDNAETYRQLLDAVLHARRTIWIAQLAFDTDFAIHGTPDNGASPSPGDGATTRLAEVLQLVSRRSAVDVRILLNASVLLDTTRPLARCFATDLVLSGFRAGRVEVRGFRCFPQLLHAKMVLIDEEDAFLLGSPFANGYEDDAHHPPVDPRRPRRELAGRPLHDVSLRLGGQPVERLVQFFEELWSYADGSQTTFAPIDHLPFDGSSPDEPEPATDGTRVLTSFPRRLFAGVPDGRTEILDALLAGIARARRFIYVENQYLSARPVVAALAEALARESELELILVLNQNPDVTAYRRWQNARIAEHGLLAHPRVGVFSLWSESPPADGVGPTTLNQVFVHSKVVVIDDAWALVGTANLDGASLHSYGDDFTSRLARAAFRHVRNVDVAVVVGEHDREPGHDAPRALRRRLWSEHLGLVCGVLDERPPTGWLELWRACAAHNITALNGWPTHAGPDRASPSGMSGFVLPYSTRSTPCEQLNALGVQTDPTRLTVHFDPGWIEVLASPQWVRNIFA